MVVDVALPGLSDALAVTRRIVAAGAGVKVVVLGRGEHDGALFRALRAGARAFLERGTDPHELLRAVRSLAAGDALLSPSLTRRLIDELASQPDPCRPAPERLSPATAKTHAQLVTPAYRSRLVEPPRAAARPSLALVA